MKQVVRLHWWQVLARQCCGTCTHSDSYGKEIPPSDMTLCNLHGTVERVRRENNCPDYNNVPMIDNHLTAFKSPFSEKGKNQTLDNFVEE